MKFIFSVLTLVIIALNFNCSPQRFTNCYKGRLEDIPNCGAPVIRILEGDLSQINYEPNWQNPDTGENFTNVFVVRNYCVFQDKNFGPGDEFYFVVQTSMKSQSCVICAAAFPVPSKTNIIKLVPERPCQ